MSQLVLNVPLYSNGHKVITGQIFCEFSHIIISGITPTTRQRCKTNDWMPNFVPTQLLIRLHTLCSTVNSG